MSLTLWSQEMVSSVPQLYIVRLYTTLVNLGVQRLFEVFTAAMIHEGYSGLEFAFDHCWLPQTSDNRCVYF